MSNVLNFILIKAKNLKRSFKQSLSWIWMLIVLLSPFIQLYCNSRRVSICVELLAISIGFILMYADQYNYNKPSVEGMPVMRKKLVRYEKSTAKVTIKKEDMNEIANYLLDLQEYFEQRGMINEKD